jgi:drug/metabolite transporter (DMT)-like permease
VLLALGTVYVVWGSTYLAMRIAMDGLPPLLMAGSRSLLAGGLLFAVQRWRGEANPSLKQWRNSALIGVLMVSVGNGGVAISEQWVASGLAAVMVGAVPLWAALIGGLFGRWPTRREAIGLAIGAVGVLLLNLGGDLRSNPLGAVVLVVATASWALGSILSKQLDLPRGLINSAVQMLCGGGALMVASLVHGDRPLPGMSFGPVAAMVYLIVFGSLLAYSAYSYLLREASPAVATSYAFVNPVIAVLLGVAWRGERPDTLALVAMGIILGGVSLVVRKK